MIRLPRDKDIGEFVKEQECNQYLAVHAMKMTKPTMVYAELGHGSRLEIIKTKSGLEKTLNEKASYNGENLKYAPQYIMIAAYITENINDIISTEDYLDICYPIEADDDESMRKYKQDCRDDMLEYNGVAASLFWEVPDYSNSLDDVATVEEKTIEKVGYENYVAILSKFSNNPVTATPKERVAACMRAWRDDFYDLEQG